MKKKTSWKFTDESSVTFQLSISGAGEFGLCLNQFYEKKNSIRGKKLHEMKNEKKYMDFLMIKIWQILKCFCRALS